MESLPRIEIGLSDLNKLLGKTLSPEQAVDILFGLKCEPEEVKDNQLTLDVLADRPDLLSVEGIVREVRGILGLERGLAKYPVSSGPVSVTVDPAAVGVRAYIACAVVRGLSLDDESLRQAMQLQEKLHVTYCRKRRAASIGVYDLDTISSEICYTALKPEEIRFRPLEGSTTLSGAAILNQTEQGRAYGGILSDFEKYPLLVDAKGAVLSMPPIVNSEETKVTLDTRNLFIDVTGVSERLVNQVLNILACGLTERGGGLESVAIAYPERKARTPDLEPMSLKMRSSYANASLGTRLTTSEIAKHLGRMRFGVRTSGKGILSVRVPAYRVDVIGEIDLVEDLAISYGLNQIKPTLPVGYTIGSELQRTRAARLVREALVGLGFQEVLSFIMTNPRVQYELMEVEPAEYVEVQNPMSQEYSTLRTWILPHILKFLRENRHVSLPHRVYECGDVVLVDEAQETGAHSERWVAAAMADHEVGYEDIQAVLQAFLHEFAVEYQLERFRHPSLLAGRTAQVKVGGTSVGFVGEMNPVVISNFELETPVAVFEMNVDSLTRLLCRGG